jgi:hypothetical protein
MFQLLWQLCGEIMLVCYSLFLQMSWNKYKCSTSSVLLINTSYNYRKLFPLCYLELICSLRIFHIQVAIAVQRAQQDADLLQDIYKEGEGRQFVDPIR